MMPSRRIRVTGFHSERPITWTDFQAPDGQWETGIRYESFSHWGMIETHRYAPIDLERSAGWFGDAA